MSTPEGAPPRRALLIEDDEDIARLVALHLQDIHIGSDIAGSGTEGLDRFQRQQYDLVVLDLMLPGKDGLSVCRELRAVAPYVPILMLTAKSTELDRVVGLEIGADDYLTKPFSVAELVARVKALLRRVDALDGGAPAQKSTGPLRRGALCIDVDKHKVTVGNRAVELTAREFELLAFLAREPGRVYSRAELLSEIWGYGQDVYQHTVNSHINRLRAKIERDPARPRYVLTVWGVGYKFTESPA